MIFLYLLGSWVISYTFTPEPYITNSVNSYETKPYSEIVDKINSLEKQNQDLKQQFESISKDNDESIDYKNLTSEEKDLLIEELLERLE